MSSLEGVRRPVPATAHTEGLATVISPPCRIGRRVWNGRSVVARAMHVAYQQKVHVSGRIAPTYGAIRNGDGAVYGGGGSIGSRNEGVATVVYMNEDGVENTAELPADTSVREGGVFRMDLLDRRMFAVTNLSGGRSARWLLGPSDFIPGTRFRKRDLACLVLGGMAFAASSWGFVVLFALRPAWVVYRMREIARCREALGRYMASVVG